MFHKINQFTSIFNLNSSFDDVSDSPKVRIGEILNILYQYNDNKLTSIFGLGFGGYFEDHLNFFSSMDLSQGSFDDDQIYSGHFYRPHDTIPVVLLLHGFAGLFFIFYWTIVAFIKSFKSIFLLGLIPWLFLTYGFDINIAILGVIFLYLGFYQIYESDLNKC
jgi:hypothetical protein